MVIYLHIRSSRSKADLSISIDPSEVDAYTWLSHEQMGILSRQRSLSDQLRMFDAHVHPTGPCQLPFALLATADYNQSENLTNGTRFALEQLYSQNAKGDG